MYGAHPMGDTGIDLTNVNFSNLLSTAASDVIQQSPQAQALLQSTAQAAATQTIAQKIASMTPQQWMLYGVGAVGAVALIFYLARKR